MKSKWRDFFHCKSSVGKGSCVRVCVYVQVHVHACAQSCPTVNPWTVAYQALLSVEFFRQDYWSELPFSSPENLPNPGIKSTSPALQAGSLPLSHQGNPRERILLGRKRNRGKSQEFSSLPRWHALSHGILLFRLLCTLLQAWDLYSALSICYLFFPSTM